MFELLRKYASVVLIGMMSLFAVCLVADELGDIRRAWADIQMEAIAEIETTDYEWDEDGTDNGDGQISGCCCLPATQCASSADEGKRQMRSGACVSDEYRLGLVRRYAPRKGLQSHNHILT